MLRSSKNILSSWLSSGFPGDEKLIRCSHSGKMSNIKMQVNARKGYKKDWFSKHTKIYCRQVPVCFSFPLIIVFLLLFSLFTPALSIHMESIESHSEFSCEPIRLRMCQDLPYNTTFMPNLLNHYDQQTAALAMEVSCLCVDDACFVCVYTCVCHCTRVNLIAVVIKETEVELHIVCKKKCWNIEKKPC